MKKIIFLIGFIFLLFFSINKVSVAAPVDRQCLTITGRFTATNWKDGNIMVACQGLNAGLCVGDKAKVKPNGEFTLKGCACPFNTAHGKDVPKGWADGCLYVAKKLDLKPQPDRKNRPGVVVVTGFPKECTLNPKKFEAVKDFKNHSGLYKTSENLCGKNGLPINVNIKANCPGPSVTPTPTPTPSPTPSPSSCPTPAPVLNVKITCPNCEEASPSPSPIPVDENTQ